MEEVEDVEKIFFNFQTLVSRHNVLQKSYTTSGHLKKIIRSLPSKWRLNVTVIQETKDPNKLSLEELMSSLICHEIELKENDPKKKYKSLTLKSQEKKKDKL